jgi:hypothetical protein
VRSRRKIGATFFLTQGEASSSGEDSSLFRSRIAAPTSHGPSPVHSYLLYYLPNLDILYLRTIKHGTARALSGVLHQPLIVSKPNVRATFRARPGLRECCLSHSRDDLLHAVRGVGRIAGRTQGCVCVPAESSGLREVLQKNS